MKNFLNWLFGRGASVASGLNWTVPKAWKTYDRDDLISRIKKQISIEMEKSSTEVYKKLLSILSKKTKTGFRHRLP